jgi:hypothetical protein
MANDAKMLFTGSDDMTIGIWEMDNRFLVGRLEGHKDSKSTSIVTLNRHPRLVDPK